MSVAVQVEVTKDTARPAIAAVMRVMQPAVYQPVIGRSGANTVRQHLFGLNSTRPNRLGGRRTNFYAAAARGTSFRTVGSAVVVSIAQVGIALRFFGTAGLPGGVMVPKTRKFLTIPARAEAHGKRASEFNDLELVFGRGGIPVALARRAQSTVGRVKDRKTGRHAFVSRGEAGGEIMFWLVKSVTQRPDPSVLPTRSEIFTNIETEMRSLLNRELARAGGRPS